METGQVLYSVDHADLWNCGDRWLGIFHVFCTSQDNPGAICLVLFAGMPKQDILQPMHTYITLRKCSQTLGHLLWPSFSW
jgi:hypothetical protein